MDMMTKRCDDPAGVMEHAGRYDGARALIVLGGPSGRHWKELRDRLQPDVILGANGTCFEIPDLDYHMVVENMHMSAKRAAQGEERYRQMMGILSGDHQAKVRLVSYLSWDLLDEQIDNAIRIRRLGELGSDYDAQMTGFNFRDYGEGYLAGPLFTHPGALTSSRIQFRIGTVATQLIHHAGILGVSDVHTIGMDFCNYAHWYKYPDYQPDKFRTGAMFTEYAGLPTQWDWVKGAVWLQSLQWAFDRDGLEWVDHSDGLFKAMRLFCATSTSTILRDAGAL